ncbi:MAG: hypothetical protein PHU63_02700 [Candidatus ainarchaeum sp.]|nr:hypothetical protein [Candidatus ainarchaeum sp.]
MSKPVQKTHQVTYSETTLPKLTELYPSITQLQIDNWAGIHLRQMGDMGFPREIREKLDQFFGDVHFVHVHQGNVHLIIKKDEKYYDFSISLTEFKKQGFTPLLNKAFEVFKLNKSDQLVYEDTDAKKRYRTTLFDYLDMYYFKLLFGAYGNSLQNGDIYINSFDSGSFQRFSAQYSKFEGTLPAIAKAEVEPRELPLPHRSEEDEESTGTVRRGPDVVPVPNIEYTFTNPQAIRDSIIAHLKSLNISISETDLQQVTSYSRALWQDKQWAEASTPKGPLPTYPYAITGGSSFFVIKEDNIHIFLRDKRQMDQQVELVLPLVRNVDGSIDFTRTFANYYDFLKPSTTADKREHLALFGNHEAGTAVLTLYEQAMVQGSPLQDKLYFMILDGARTTPPAVGATKKPEQWSHHLHFRIVAQEDAIREAKEYQIQLEQQQRFGEFGATKETIAEAGQKAVVTRAVLDQMAETRTRLIDDAARINEYITDSGWASYTHAGRTYAYLKASQKELEAMDTAIRAYRDEGNATPLMELLLSYQLWSAKKGKERTAHTHVQDLTIILMHRMQLSGIVGEPRTGGFTGIKAVHTTTPKLKASEFSNPEDILLRAKTTQGRREIFGILQTWQNQMFGELRVKGYDISGALYFLELGTETFGKSTTRTPAVSYIQDLQLFKEAFDNPEVVTTSHQQAIKRLLEMPGFADRFSGVRNWEQIQNRLIDSNIEQVKDGLLGLKQEGMTARKLEQLLASNPVDFYLGPMTLTAFAFIAAQKVQDEIRYVRVAETTTIGVTDVTASSTGNHRIFTATLADPKTFQASGQELQWMVWETRERQHPGKILIEATLSAEERIRRADQAAEPTYYAYVDLNAKRADGTYPVFVIEDPETVPTGTITPGEYIGTIRWDGKRLSSPAIDREHLQYMINTTPTGETELQTTFIGSSQKMGVVNQGVMVSSELTATKYTYYKITKTADGRETSEIINEADLPPGRSWEDK